MSSSDFVKGSCHHCGGHLEFPAEAIGQSTPCPHCGQTTELSPTISTEKPAKSVRKRQAIAVAIALCAVIPTVLLALHKRGDPGISGHGVPEIIHSNTTEVVKSPAPPRLRPEVETNDFAIMPYKLEKTAGSTLVYVMGTVRNLANQQRFGVKLEFGLFDTNDNYLGAATDYQSVLSSNGVWRFKAMVMASKTTYARFTSIAEDK